MKRIIQILLVVVIAGLAYLLMTNIRKPIDFQNEYEARKKAVVERLKDIRALQIAYKSVRGYYTDSFDTLENFYKTGKMQTLISFGSLDDSLTAANTKAYEKLYDEQQKLIKARRPIKGDKLIALVDMPEAEIFKRGLAVRKPVFNDVKAVLKVDTILLANRPDFNIEELRFIPIISAAGDSDRPKFEMETRLKEVSKIQIPLFEARVPYEVFLKGLDKQQIMNLIDEKVQKNNFTNTVEIVAVNDTVIGKHKFNKGETIEIPESEFIGNKLVAEFANKLSAVEKKAFNEEKCKWAHYPGLRVGSIVNPNNDAGNWE